MLESKRAQFRQDVAGFHLPPRVWTFGLVCSRNQLLNNNKSRKNKKKKQGGARLWTASCQPRKRNSSDKDIIVFSHRAPQTKASSGEPRSMAEAKQEPQRI
jgi:hypothetical protein